MRIIAGKYRGRVLAEFKGKAVRPTADRVKESLFSILTPRLAGARVLDLFCGSGALGIECLSRGAKEVYFNDSAAESLEILKKNLSLVGEHGEISRLDFRACLSSVRGTFELIFADPPYACDYLPEILRIAKERDLTGKTGLIIYESERSEPAAEGWQKADERRYGRTYLGFFRRSEP